MSERSPLLSDPTFEVLVRSPAEITVLLDADGEILYVSPNLEEVLGVRSEEMTGKPSLGAVHPGDRERVEAMLAELAATPDASDQIEYRVRHADGSWRVLNTTAWNLLEDERVGAVLVRSRDVTLDRGLLARVDRTERYLEQVVNNVPVVFFLLDPEGTVLLSEGKGLEGLGLEPGEVVGQAALDLYGDQPGVPAALEAALAGEETRATFTVEGRVYETLFSPRTDAEGTVLGISGVAFDRTEEVRAREDATFRGRLLDAIGQAVIVTDADGSITYWNRAATEIYGWERDEVLGRPVADVTVPESRQEEADEILAGLEASESWSGEFRVRRKDGTTFPALVTDAPIFDDSGELAAVIGVSVDLTDRKELEARLHDARRAEAIGRLAGGVAHDFNNLLTALRGYVRLLLDEVSRDDTRLRPDLEAIDRTARRAADLTAQLLAYSRRQVSQPRQLDLAGLVESMSEGLDEMLGDETGVRVATTGPCLVEIDPSQVEQMLVHLARNARDAMPGGGEMEISVAPATLDEDLARELACEEIEGPWVELAVRDSGIGIEQDDLPHVFEPFYTKRPNGNGRGLGLATVYGIVMQNGGCVRIESEPGRVTTFHIYLPGAGPPSTPLSP